MFYIKFSLRVKRRFDPLSDQNGQTPGGVGRTGLSVCIVETPGDQPAIEESGTFRERYHVLHGKRSPLDGIGPDDLEIIVLATNPTAEGEATASYMTKLLTGKGLKISRIVIGVPMGGDLKYMESMTLQHSLESRVPVIP